MPHGMPDAVATATAPAPDIVDPTEDSVRARLWKIAGALALALAVAVWLVGNVRLGVAWQDARTPVVANGQTWSGAGVTVSVNEVAKGTTITLDVGDPIKATPGAIYVAVVLDYTLTDAGVDDACLLDLLGDHREWSRTSASTLSEVMPGDRNDCTNRDDLGNPVTSGRFGALFEVPTAALGEITGVRITVMDSTKTVTNLPTLFASRAPTAALRLDLPS